MQFNILLRFKVVQLIQRYLEDVHGFVVVLSYEFITKLFSLFIV